MKRARSIKSQRSRTIDLRGVHRGTIEVIRPRFRSLDIPEIKVIREANR